MLILIWGRPDSVFGEIGTDPTRSWEGPPFADAVWDWLRRNEPQIKLSLPLTTESGESVIPDDRYAGETRAGNIGSAAKETLIERSRESLVVMMMEAVPKDLRWLGKHLYAGNRIVLRGELATENIERRLREWLLSVPDGAAAPHEVFGRAIAAAEGNILRAHVALWNVFSEGWIAAGLRNENPISRKLMDVTGERHLQDGVGRYIVSETPIEVDGYRDNGGMGDKRGNRLSWDERKIKTRIRFVISKRGDTFSSFYHFIGVSLLSSYASTKLGSGFVGELLGRAGALAEARLHVVTSGLQVERQKRIRNDLNAAEAGARLFEIMRTPERYPLRQAAMKAQDYLMPSKAYEGHYRLPEGVPPAYFGSRVDSKYWSSPMDIEELKMRFEYALWVDGHIFNGYILASSTDGDRLFAGLAKYLAEGATDTSLNQMIEDFRNGAFGRSQSKTSLNGGAGDGDFSITDRLAKMHLAATIYNGDSYDPREIKYRLDRLMNRIVLESSRSCRGIFIRAFSPRPAD